VTGSNPVTLEAARSKLPSIEVMASDAGDVAVTKALVDAVKAKYGRIDVLFVNAGIAQFAPMGDMTLEQAKAMIDGIAAQVPLGRVGQPEEIAAAALYFASDESAFTTGTELFVDGGFTQI